MNLNTRGAHCIVNGRQCSLSPVITIPPLIMLHWTDAREPPPPSTKRKQIIASMKINGLLALSIISMAVISGWDHFRFYMAWNCVMRITRHSHFIFILVPWESLDLNLNFNRSLTGTWEIHEILELHEFKFFLANNKFNYLNIWT